MSKQNRRQFLEDSMVAAAAVAAGSSSQTLLADDTAQSRSPGEKLGVACVGVRGRGGSHIGAFAGRKDTEVLYICDVDSEIGGNRTKEVAKRQGREPKLAEDLRQVLEDTRVDIVSIATPNHLHAMQAIWAIQADKDVYVEKPVSHNVSEGRRVVEAARRYGRICQTGTQSRSNPGMIAAIQYVLDGNIGQVKLARGLCYKKRGSIGPRRDYPVPSNLNYDLWLGPAPTAPITRKQFHYDWHWQWPYGNGDLGNQGIHQMDLCRWALGVNELSNRVVSYGGRFGYEDAGDTANTQVIVHDFGDKSLVFEVRGLPTGKYQLPGMKADKKENQASIGIIVEGTEGYLVVGSYKSGTAFNKDGEIVDTFTGGNDKLHFENFLNAVRSRNHQDLNADIEDGHLSSALCHLGNISYQLGSRVDYRQVNERLEDFPSTDNMRETLNRTLSHLRHNEVDPANADFGMGQPLVFDPKSETFVDNAAADRLLTREYRHPFVVPEAGQV